MPYNYRRKRTFRRRRPMTRKRMYRKRYSRRGNYRSNKGVYYFKRKSSAVYDWVTGNQITQIVAGAGGSDIVANIGFRLQDVPSYTDFAMYDQYRIAAVKLNFIPVNNVSTWTGSTGGIVPGSFAMRAFTAYDPNADGSGVSSVGQVQEYQNAKWTPYNRIHKRYVKPRIMLSEASGSTLGINLVGKQPWIQNDAAGVGTIYYGVPFAMDNTSTGVGIGTLMYKLECTYYLQFKVPK